MNLTAQVVGSYSANAASDANARALANKNAFPALCVSEDDNLIFGECEGSAKENYRCSADFSDPDGPVFSCTCPSRQIPCKHVLGLMYSYVLNKKFSVSRIPDEILEKREARQKKKERKQEQGEKKPRQVNKDALRKKIYVQLEGLGILKKLLDDIICGGLGAVNTKTCKLLDEQIRNLGNYYLSGAQDLLREFNVLMRATGDREKVYSPAIQCLNAAYSFYRKSVEHLESRLNDPELKIKTDSVIEELLGHIWQFGDLEEQGLVVRNVELVQLSFDSHSSTAALSVVDEGIWCSLADGRIFRSLNYRPYRAAIHIKEDDTFFDVLKAEKLGIYPGDTNNRIRWETYHSRKAEKPDFARVKSFATGNFSDVLKQVKNVVKNPLGARYPLSLLNYSAISTIDGSFVVNDSEGQQIALEDNDCMSTRTCRLLRYVDDDCIHNQAILVRFFYDIDRNFLQAQPLSIVTDDRIIRLAF